MTKLLKLHYKSSSWLLHILHWTRPSCKCTHKINIETRNLFIWNFMFWNLHVNIPGFVHRSRSLSRWLDITPPITWYKIFLSSSTTLCMGIFRKQHCARGEWAVFFSHLLNDTKSISMIVHKVRPMWFRYFIRKHVVCNAHIFYRTFNDCIDACDLVEFSLIHMMQKCLMMTLSSTRDPRGRLHSLGSFYLTPRSSWVTNLVCSIFETDNYII